MLERPQSHSGDADARALYETFLAHAASAPDAITAVMDLLAPDARVHVQNGDVVPPEIAMRHTTVGRTAFPDLTVTIEDVFFPPGHLVFQVTTEGTAGPNIPFLPQGFKLASPGAVVIRPAGPDRIGEYWSYVNPGFAFTFPRTGVDSPVPPEDGAGAEQATALYDEWLRRATAGEPFFQAIAATAAPDSAVHLGNGDVGGAHLLNDIFDKIARGLPDISLEIDAVLLEGAKLVVQFSMVGTHLGPMGVWPPTGRRLPSTGALIARANASGQAAELWVYVAPGYAITVPPSGSPRA